MRWYKIHELTPWSEAAILRHRQALPIAGPNPDLDRWRQLLPDAPEILIEPGRSALAVMPVTDREPDQVMLGVVARGLPWQVSNALHRLNPILPFRLAPLIGRDAFTKPNSWYLLTYQYPLVFERRDQRYEAGFDAMLEDVAQMPTRQLTVGALRDMSVKAIGRTLSGKEAHEFWMGYR